MRQAFDLVVLGSGAAGLTSALVAADAGCSVLVLERSALFGGTTSISGGQVWAPDNHLQRADGYEDGFSLARTYLGELTMGLVDPRLLDAFIRTAPEMIAYLEEKTRIRFFMVQRHDYHSEWPGAAYGRSLEPKPFDLTALGTLATALRRSPLRPPLTSAEIKRGAGKDLIDARIAAHETTQGSALVAGLLAACNDRGVEFRLDCRARNLLFDGRVRGVRYEGAGHSHEVDARAVIVASGGFEWNDTLKRTFLTSPDEGAASPPWNEGDGLLMGLRVGAAVDCMTESWWSAAYAVPGECYDGRPTTRNIVRELALPGSILVNARGRRFVNEASSYNDLGKAFQVFDPDAYEHVNKRAWLVFDGGFKSRYSVAGCAPTTVVPDWIASAPTLEKLAEKVAIDGVELEQTVDRFNAMARAGRDTDFHRGDARHDRYHGDATRPNPNLGELTTPPYHALPIFLGNLGTKGGMRTDTEARVLDNDGNVIDGFYACGNAAASWMGPGYPGAGGSLGPIMAMALRCGRAASADRPFESRQSTPEGTCHGT